MLITLIILMAITLLATYYYHKKIVAINRRHQLLTRVNEFVANEDAPGSAKVSLLLMFRLCLSPGFLSEELSLSSVDAPLVDEDELLKFHNEMEQNELFQEFKALGTELLKINFNLYWMRYTKHIAWSKFKLRMKSDDRKKLEHIWEGKWTPKSC